MIGLSDLRALADGARAVKRNPVKTHFIQYERRIVEDFFRSQPRRDLSSDRMRSFLALCGLLGKPLDASDWHRLEYAVKGAKAELMRWLRFLVGGGTVKGGNDWQLKCLGLAEGKPEGIRGGPEPNLL